MTGMSGAGKTTLAFGVQEILARQGYNVYVMDADEYRKTLCKDLGFSREDRLTNIKRLAARAKELSEEYDLIIIAAINPFEEGRVFLREMYNSPLLYVKCELDQLIERDPKGLYQKALLPEGHPDHITNFTGISDPFEQLGKVDWIIDTSSVSIEDAIAQFVVYIQDYLKEERATVFFREFLSTLEQHTKSLKANKTDAELTAEQVFRSIFEIPVYDLMVFLYHDFRNLEQFESWIRKDEPEQDFKRRIAAFYRLLHAVDEQTDYRNQVLTTEQWQHWKEKGYIQISGLISEEDCDNVKEQICNYLEIDMLRSETWWPQDDRKLHSILLPSLVTPETKDISYNEQVRRVFEDLYESTALVPKMVPLGYNPPETSLRKFRGTGLHWDIDFEIGARYYIQGLIYLDDVDADGGAFSLIPGYQHKLDELLQEHGTADNALKWLEQQQLQVNLAGKKGDLILWLETLPHAATPNRMDKPRFVQYVAYQKVEILTT
jgi:adenylylsulfate kinase-like enzyme